MSRYDYTHYPPPFSMGLMKHLSHPKPLHKLKLVMQPPTTAKDAISQVRLDVDFARAQSTDSGEAAVMTSISALKMLLDEIEKLRAELQMALEATEPRAELLALKTRAEKAEGELDSLRADKARLDWMQEHKCHEGVTMAVARYSYRIAQWDGSDGPNIRLAIDTERNAP